MTLGGLADLPLRLGGGPQPSESAYQVLRNAVGKGGSAEDDTKIEGLWRRSEAKGVASAMSHKRRALIQANPLFATDTLAYYERILGVVPPEGASEAERRAAVVPLWARRIDASVANVAAELEALDARFSVIESPEELSVTTQPGRAFGSRVELMVLPGEISRVANHSSDFTLRVLFTLGYAGVPTTADRLLIHLAQLKLRELAQGWEDFTISTGPWVIGITPIGLGHVG
jgi:hypothetical protein